MRLTIRDLLWLDVAVASARWAQILEQLTANFECVLADTGSPTEPAASTLVRIADATYPVVQLGTVEEYEAQRALADFRVAGA